MSFVYMDQWVYVNLLRCKNKQTPEYPKYYETLKSVIETSKNNIHKYPFSIAHIEETLKRTKLNSRKELFKFIFEISKFNTINLWIVVLDLEIRNAIMKFVGKDPIDLHEVVFADEIGHCFGSRGTFVPKSGNDEIPKHILNKLHETYRNPEMMSELLSNDKMSEIVDEIIKEDKDMATKLEDRRKNEYSHPDKKKRKNISYARFFIDIIQDEFIKAIHEFDLDFKEFTKYVFQNEKFATSFLKSIPSAYIFHILNDARNMNFSRPIEPNDLLDIGTLAIAIPYCDIVVTEREWANILNQKKIGELYNTKIIHKIENLPSIL